MTAKFNLSDKVWRVQGNINSDQGLYVYGPATVTALVQRKSSVTYLLTHERGMGERDLEVTDEEDGERLYLSEKAAQAAANQEHNDNLERQKRPVA